MLRISITIALCVLVLFGVTAQGQNNRRTASSPYLFAETRLTMPMLALAGENASGNFLIEQVRLVDTDVSRETSLKVQDTG